MNIWENGVVTNKGLSLLSKLIEGNSLEITRAVTAMGYVTPGLLQSQTDVKEAAHSLKFRSLTYPAEGKCALTVYLNNDDVTTGYTAMQVGIYATDPDEGEILFFIVQAESGTGTIVPSAAEMPGYNAEWTFYFQYGNADNVTVMVDPSNTATLAMLDGKADKDFGNVTNTIFLEKAIISGAAIPIVTTTGGSQEYAANVPGMETLNTGMTFIMIPHVTSSTTMPSLNVNGLGKLPLRQQLSHNTAGTAPGAIDTWLSQGKPCLVTYDGSLWKVNITRPVASSLYGVVPVEKGGTGASTAEEALENLGAASKAEVMEIETKLDQLKSALLDDITGNPHSITFETLDGLIVTGVWNEAKARMEC